MPALSNMAVRDIETVLHPFTNLQAHREIGPLIVERGEGVFLYDSEGKRYFEGLAGLWCLSLGHGRQELVEAAAKQMAKLPFATVFGGKSHDLVIELAEKLKEMVPCEASKVLFCAGGSEANDMQVKLTWYYNNARGRPQKKKIISRLRGYHGVTVASGSLTGLPTVHTDFDLPIANILHTACPLYYRYGLDGESEDEFSTRMAAELNELIEREGPETIAAFIAEPVMGAGGVVVPPKDYFKKIGAVLAKHDVRVISDEVICGFGRTGEWFGAEAHGFEPTSVSMAKALTASYFPLGAITLEDDVYEAMTEQSVKIGTFGHGYTYTAHPVACAVALKAIEIYERDDIVGHVRKVAQNFARRFERLLGHPLVGNVRYSGLMGAAELVAEKRTKRPFDPKMLVGPTCATLLQGHGVVTRSMGDSLALCPPLVISEDEIDEMFDLVEKALDDTEAWVRRESLRAA